MNQSNKPVIYRLALTGGPCSGKTTGQARISTFFENLGWKVYRVPETASILFGGGIRFADLNKKEANEFQENLLITMMSIEKTFFELSELSKKNCLIICDRGTMDAAAYMSKEAYDHVLNKNNLNTVDIRDNRYHQVLHLVTAAKGAENFYNTEDNPARSEGLDLAKHLDELTAEAWVGHPYMDVIDNSTGFEAKIKRMITAICRRMGIDTGDRLVKGSKKHKFLLKELPPELPSYQDFDVVHHYLVSSNPNIQARLRKRGQRGFWSYQHTIRRLEANNQVVEVRRQINHRDYMSYLAQRDNTHYTVFKTRRCFLYDHTYFQIDMYKPPSHTRCEGLILMEIYTTMEGEELMKKIPPIFKELNEVTGDPKYSMYNLSLRGEWNSKNFLQVQSNSEKCSKMNDVSNGVQNMKNSK